MVVLPGAILIFWITGLRGCFCQDESVTSCAVAEDFLGQALLSVGGLLLVVVAPTFGAIYTDGWCFCRVQACAVEVPPL
jgi:hypothetical protein